MTSAATQHPEILIRAANPIDVPQIRTLIAPFVEQKKLLPRSDEELTELTRNGFVAEVDKQVVGFAAVEVYSRKLAELVCLAVAEPYQGMGIGRRLVRQCIRRARELNILELMAISASDGFLKSCGFDYSLPEQKRALFYQPLADKDEVD
ncbi:MAG: N-acetylglutamate synthase [Pirellulaceae bacterium]|nr:MAG: N-acetylglutamate synthase [Pirellulaceae bacterium]